MPIIQTSHQKISTTLTYKQQMILQTYMRSFDQAHEDIHLKSWKEVINVHTGVNP